MPPFSWNVFAIQTEAARTSGAGLRVEAQGASTASERQHVECRYGDLVASDNAGWCPAFVFSLGLGELVAARHPRLVWMPC
ncbi:hypothetical protein SBA7_80014 [Candidatus Sulfotelmatobacter sp. SbA7]|nr:hypothetical protein SBA7_80014 [Candidatus Sulfotelmatobacter sp. SbA7]